MEPVLFQFLTHAEFFELSQEEKASYLIRAVKELADMTATLGTPERNVAPPESDILTRIERGNGQSGRGGAS